MKEEVKKIEIIENESGSSGTSIYAGYYDEEYLKELVGQEAAEAYDKMRRNDPQIILALSAPINAILGGAWGVSPASSEEKDQEIADFVKFIFFEDLDKPFPEKLREILSFIAFGFSIFERVHKVVMSHPKWGNYLGIKKIAFRSQKTIDRWIFENKELVKVRQIAFGDLNASVDIPVENLLIFTVNQEGDNYEGISMLRPCYGPWFRKQLYLKLDAIGIEKTALGTTKGKYPSGSYGTPEYTRFKNILKSISSHQKNFIIIPDMGNSDSGNWDVDILKLDYDSQKVNVSIDREDKSILRAFVAGFLMLGQSGSTGSWSLSTDQSDFFLNGIVYIADIIAAKLNRLVKEVVDWKYGPQEKYPELTHQGIKDKAGEEWQRIVCGFKSAGLIKPDRKLEDAIREKYDMPEKDEESEYDEPVTINPFASPETPEDNTQDEPVDDEQDTKEQPKEKPEIKKQSQNKTREFSEVSKQIDAYSNRLKTIQKKMLTDISEDMIKQVVRKFEESNDTAEIDSIYDIKIRKVSPYKQALNELLNEASGEAQDKAETLVKKKTKLSEVTLAKKKDTLKKKTSKYNKVMSNIYAETQAADLHKAIVLQFGSSINSTKDSRVIESDLRESTTKAIARDTNAAGLVISQSVAKARENYFFDDDIKSEIESFTFRNDDPISNICVSLNGVTFRSDDADSYRYMPPLHHNCKSYLEPNFRGAKNNPEPTGLKPSKSDQKDITLKDAVIRTDIMEYCTCKKEL